MYIKKKPSRKLFQKKLCAELYYKIMYTYRHRKINNTRSERIGTRL